MLELMIALEGTLRNIRDITLPPSIAESDIDRSFTVLFIEFSLKTNFKRISVNNSW